VTNVLLNSHGWDSQQRWGATVLQRTGSSPVQNGRWSHLEFPQDSGVRAWPSNISSWRNPMRIDNLGYRTAAAKMRVSIDIFTTSQCAKKRLSSRTAEARRNPLPQCSGPSLDHIQRTDEGGLIIGLAGEQLLEVIGSIQCSMKTPGSWCRRHTDWHGLQPSAGQ
jgi:hypothetical protein